MREEYEPESDTPEEGDIITSDHLHWYQYGKLYVIGDEQEVLTQMDQSQFWPNVWFLSDHGNLHPNSSGRKKNENN